MVILKEFFEKVNSEKISQCAKNSLHAGHFFMIFCHLQIFLLQSNRFQKILSGLPSEYKTFLDPDLACHFVGPDLDPNCLNVLSVDNTRRQRVKSFHKHACTSIQHTCSY